MMLSKTAVVGLALSLALAGCNGAEAKNPAKTGGADKLEAGPALRLTALACGNVTINDVSALTPGHNAGKKKKLTNTCFLVEHNQGVLLWDTGLNDGLGAEPLTVFDGLFELSVTQPLLPQLAQMGYAPADIDFLALSHFHDDHAGNANAFSAATLLIQKAEQEAAFGEHPEAYGFARPLYESLDPSQAQVFEAEHDVFGDGTVLLLPAPGHSPGHQVLFVDLEETGPVLLSGDLYHFTVARELQSVPSFNASPEASRQSMKRIEGFIAERGAQLWIQHDYEQMSQLRFAPESYR